MGYGQCGGREQFEIGGRLQKNKIHQSGSGQKPGLGGSWCGGVGVWQ